MDLESFRKWIRLIYATQDRELDCEAFFEAIPQYVDTEIAGGEAPLRFPLVYYHMRQCPHCYDLYLGLRDAARSELEGETEELVAVRSDKRPSER